MDSNRNRWAPSPNASEVDRHGTASSGWLCSSCDTVAVAASGCRVPSMSIDNPASQPIAMVGRLLPVNGAGPSKLSSEMPAGSSWTSPVRLDVDVRTGAPSTVIVTDLVGIAEIAESNLSVPSIGSSRVSLRRPKVTVTRLGRAAGRLAEVRILIDRRSRGVAKVAVKVGRRSPAAAIHPVPLRPSKTAPGRSRGSAEARDDAVKVAAWPASSNRSSCGPALLRTVAATPKLAAWSSWKLRSSAWSSSPCWLRPGSQAATWVPARQSER